MCTCVRLWEGWGEGGGGVIAGLQSSHHHMHGQERIRAMPLYPEGLIIFSALPSPPQGGWQAVPHITS